MNDKLKKEFLAAAETSYENYKNKITQRIVAEIWNKEPYQAIGNVKLEEKVDNWIQQNRKDIFDCKAIARYVFDINNKKEE